MEDEVISDGTSYDSELSGERVHPVVPEEHDAHLSVDTAVHHAQQTPGVVVSGNFQDTVLLSACIYKNIYSRKSLTVHHLQRRLNDLGFVDAYSDVDGWYGDLTQHSVQEFQKANNLEVTEKMNEETFVKIFAGDPHVIITV